MIEKTLIEKLDKLEEVPEGKIKRLWTCFYKSDYFEMQITKYDDIQEYFQYYVMSLQPMVYAYTILNQPQLVEMLLEDSKSVFEHKNLSNMVTVEYLLPNRKFEDVWYKVPKRYEQNLLESYCEKKELSFKIKGQEVLEVINGGKEEK